MSAHLAIGVGLFVSGVWRIDRMEPGRLARSIAIMVPLPAPEGGPKPGHKPEDPPKTDRKRKPPVITQPLAQVTEPSTTTETTDADRTGAGAGAGSGSADSTGTCTENCVGTTTADPVCGNSSVELGEQCDDGNTLDGDGCSSTCRTEVKRAAPVTITPMVLRGLRVSGDTDVHPSTATQNLMLHDLTREVNARILVCVGVDGSVASATLKAPTGYPDYDAALVAAVRAWRYRPYAIGSTPVPACGMVTFHYVMR